MEFKNFFRNTSRENWKKKYYVFCSIKWTDFDVICMKYRGRHGCDRIVAGFTTNCAISAYHHYRFEFKSCSWRGVLDTTLCDRVCQWLATGWWFISPCTPVSSTNKTDRNNITEILLKVVLNTITLTRTCEKYREKHVENYKIY